MVRVLVYRILTMDTKSVLEKKFKAMNMPDLKKYLQARGISVNSYLKPGLVSIACAVEEMNLPLVIPPNEAEEKVNMNRRLYVHDIQLPDPFAMNVVNDFNDSPPFGLFDIFNHLIYHSTDYDKQGLGAFKSYEDYSLFHDGYVESLLTCFKKRLVYMCMLGKLSHQ